MEKDDAMADMLAEISRLEAERDALKAEVERLKADLSHANGALNGDIYTLVTSCVPRNADPEMHDIFRAVLGRILSSDSSSHLPPSWCIHRWEQDLWRKYLAGEHPVCGGGERRHKIPNESVPPMGVNEPEP